MNKIGVIIVAGGTGSRMGSETPKQFLLLAGKPVLVHTLERFSETLPNAEIIVVLPADEIDRWRQISTDYGLENAHSVCHGGETRFMSVKNALDTIGEKDYIMVHDGVRPLVSAELILRSLDSAKQNGTAIPVTEPVESFRIITSDGNTVSFDRSKLLAVQTPQVFRGDLIRQAYLAAYKPEFTDDASVVEHSGKTISLCKGERANIKITLPEDIAIAESLLHEQNAYKIQI